MAKFKIDTIYANFMLLEDEVIEAEDESEALDIITSDIIDNLGMYVDIDVYELEDENEAEDDNEEV